MMEKFFMIVSFILSDPNLKDRPLYIFAQPWFNSYNECFNFVQNNHLKLYNTAIASYNLRYVPENIYCVNHKVMKDILEYNYGTKTKKSNI